MGLIIATLIVLTVIASVVAQDFAIFSWAYWQEGDTSTSRSEVFRNVGLFFVAVVALGFGIWRAWTAHRQAEASQRQAEAANEQARIAQQGQITNLFSTAVEHLGSEQLPVRLGGIYALWRLIEDSPKRDVISVIDILCAFVRHPPHEIGQGQDPGASEDGQAAAEKAEKAGSKKNLRPDVQTVLNLIGNEEADYRPLVPDGYGLNLKAANLSYANLPNADLTGAYLMDANLTRAGLSNADLTDTRLWGANLTGADLTGAYLTGAHLTSADLTDANLWGANLTGADLTDANLAGADLGFANLTDANFFGANLTDANLTRAVLTDADNLTQEQLDSACIRKDGKPPTLREGLMPPQKICVP